MEKVTVKKQDLLEIVRDNRAKHDLLFTAAVEGFWKKATDTLSEQLEKARQREGNNVFVSLQPPPNHAKEYDHAIRALELSVDHNITLTQIEFAQLVMNDWAWKANFLNYASGYIGTGILEISGSANF